MGSSAGGGGEPAWSGGTPVTSPSTTSTSVVVSGRFAPGQLRRRKQLAPRVFVVGDEQSFAAKIIDLDSSSDIEGVVDAIRYGKMLRHHNLLPHFASFVDGTHLWIISPLCDLGSAASLSHNYGLEEALISVMMKDTLSALEYLHHRGIIHRTIQGSHILVKSNGDCLLTGLSFAVNVVRQGLRRRTLHEYPPNAVCSMNWLAPEILEQNLEGYDFKSDIYSLGTTCCELANGFPPYDNMCPTEMLLQKLTGVNPKLLDASCPELFTEFDEMSADDRERYEAYQRRRFTDSFHQFTNVCLQSDPHCRPNASQLLTHAFLRQTHKKTVRGIFSFLQSRVLVDEDEDQVASDERYQKTTRQNSSSTGVQEVQDKVWSFE